VAFDKVNHRLTEKRVGFWEKTRQSKEREKVREGMTLKKVESPYKRGRKGTRGKNPVGH